MDLGSCWMLGAGLTRWEAGGESRFPRNQPLEGSWTANTTTDTHNPRRVAPAASRGYRQEGRSVRRGGTVPGFHFDRATEARPGRRRQGAQAGMGAAGGCSLCSGCLHAAVSLAIGKPAKARMPRPHHRWPRHDGKEPLWGNGEPTWARRVPLGAAGETFMAQECNGAAWAAC